MLCKVVCVVERIVKMFNEPMEMVTGLAPGKSSQRRRKVSRATKNKVDLTRRIRERKDPRERGHSISHLCSGR